MAAAVGVVGIFGWAIMRWAVGHHDPLAEVTAAVVRATLPVTVVESGELESSQTVDVRCEVEGQQNKIIALLPEGSRVSKDQVVVRFNAEELTRSCAEQEIKVKQAEAKAKVAKEELAVQNNKAASEIAKAQLALTLAELDREKYLKGDYQVEVDDRKGAIALARRELQEAQEKLEHYRTFVRKGFGTPEQLRLKEAEVARAEYNLSRDLAKLEVLEKFSRKRAVAELTAKAEEARRELARTESTSAAGVAKAASDLEAAEVTAQLEKAQWDRLRKQLDHCVVRAPQDGILVYAKEAYQNSGKRIQPGALVHFQQPLFSLPDLSQMQVRVKVHESVVQKIKPGQEAEVRVDACPNAVLHGTVTHVATLANSGSYFNDLGIKEYVTLVRLQGFPAEADLKPGMTAEVKVLVKRLADVLVVPVQAVAARDGQHYSYLAGPKGIERRPVVIGANNETFVEIKTGVAEGEQVTLDARSRLAADAKAGERPPNDRPGPADSEPSPARPGTISRSHP